MWCRRAWDATGARRAHGVRQGATPWTVRTTCVECVNNDSETVARVPEETVSRSRASSNRGVTRVPQPLNSETQLYDLRNAPGRNSTRPPSSLKFYVASEMPNSRIEVGLRRLFNVQQEEKKNNSYSRGQRKHKILLRVPMDFGTGLQEN